MIEVEQAAEPLAPNDPAVCVGWFGRSDDQPVLDTLVISLAMVVLDELGDHVPKVSLAERHDPIEALTPDGERTNRSAKALRSGLRGGSRMTFTPARSRAFRNLTV